MGECKTSPTPGCIIAHVCRPGQVLIACGGIPHRPWLCYPKAILNQKHLHRPNLQLARDCNSVPQSQGTEAWNAVGKVHECRQRYRLPGKAKKGWSQLWVYSSSMPKYSHLELTWGTSRHTSAWPSRGRHVLLWHAPSRTAVHTLQPRCYVAGLGHSSFQLRCPPLQRKPGYLHLGMLAPSMLRRNPSRKKGVWSFAQVRRLNPSPGNVEVFLEIVEKILMPEKCAKSHCSVRLPH